MAAAEKTLCRIKPHTLAKHEILRRYLQAWFPILNSRYHRTVYIDGFCGPGRYRGGEPGSPMIALGAAIYQRQPLSGEAAFWFIDERRDRIQHLKRDLASLSIPPQFEIHAECGQFDKQLDTILESEKRRHGRLPPTFAFVDPFGFSGIPFLLIKGLLSHSHSEVLITLMVDPINRFLKHQHQSVQRHIVDAFGTEECIEIAAGSGDRVENLRILYHKQLRSVAQFVRSFEMKNMRKKRLYFLFFASNDSLGYEKMKEAMWKVDPEGRFSFSDTEDPSQMILFGEEVPLRLSQQLRQEFAGAGMVRVEQVKRFVNVHTDYLKKHMRAVLRREEAEGTIRVREYKFDGEKRRRGTFPDEVMLEYVGVCCDGD